MKALRTAATPTRNRRLNEILGLMVLAAAALLLLALVSYTPLDASLQHGGRRRRRERRRGARAQLDRRVRRVPFRRAAAACWVSRCFCFPVLLVRLGVCWMRSRAVGSAMAKWAGLMLWVFFAPAAIALLPGKLLWKHALPIAGLSGRLIADLMVHFLNLPGTILVVSLMVVLSLYLATTFAFNSARQWATERFAFVGARAAEVDRMARPARRGRGARRDDRRGRRGVRREA